MQVGSTRKSSRWIKTFTSKQTRNKQPVLFEVFTDQIKDRETVFALKSSYRRQYDDNAALKDAVKSVVGENTIKGIKRFFHK